MRPNLVRFVLIYCGFLPYFTFTLTIRLNEACFDTKLYLKRYNLADLAFFWTILCMCEYVCVYVCVCIYIILRSKIDQFLQFNANQNLKRINMILIQYGVFQFSAFFSQIIFSILNIMLAPQNNYFLCRTKLEEIRQGKPLNNYSVCTNTVSI